MSITWFGTLVSPGSESGSGGHLIGQEHILLGQLAVDEVWRGRRLGSDLLIDAARRSLAAAGTVGARAVIVQAVDDRARAFYEKFGFRPFSEREPLMLVLRMSEIAGLLDA